MCHDRRNWAFVRRGNESDWVSHMKCIVMFHKMQDTLCVSIYLYIDIMCEELVYIKWINRKQILTEAEMIPN